MSVESDKSIENEPTRFNVGSKPNWCPGCGNFGMQASLKKALVELDLQPHEVFLSAGIGCSGKIPQWIYVSGIHGLHGRPLPVAQGVKLANTDMVVIAEGGDGDGYSEGMCHFIHACRRNIDITYIVHNNNVFALTTGQASPTARQELVTQSTPHGVIEPPFSPIALAISAGASFVARGFSGDPDQLKDLYVAAIKHHGFALVDVMQVCVTYNPERSYKWYQEKVYKIEEEDHDPTDRGAALTLAMNGGLNNGKLATGVFYKSDRPAFEDSLVQLEKESLVNQQPDEIDVDHLMDALI